MKEELYIPAESFSIHQRYMPNFGIFYAVRVLLSIRAEGGLWWQKFAFYSCFTALLMPVALCIDIASLAAYICYLIVKKLFQIVAAAFLLLLETIIKKFVGVILLISALCISLILIYLKWPLITDFINKLF